MTKQKNLKSGARKVLVPTERFVTLFYWWAVFSVAAMAGLAGSFISAMLLGFALISIFNLLFGITHFKIERTDFIFLLPAAAFFCVQVLFALIHQPEGIDGSVFTLKILAPLIAFLLGWLLIPLFRWAKFDMLDALICGSSFCGLAALPVAVFQVLAYHIRAEGGAGNAIPFALICSTFGALSLLNTVSDNPNRVWLGWLGFFSGIICTLLSGTIGVVPFLAVISVVFSFLNRRKLIEFVKARFLFLVIAVAVLVLASAQLWVERFGNVFKYLNGERSGWQFNTFIERQQIWKLGWDLFLQQPVLGHGVENRQALIQSATGLPYTHFHNGFLSVMVDSGILGLVAVIAVLVSPAALAWLAPSDEKSAERHFIAAALVLAYALGGMTNIIFLHDIYDSLFLWLAIGLAVSVPPVLQAAKH